MKKQHPILDEARGMKRLSICIHHVHHHHLQPPFTSAQASKANCLHTLLERPPSTRSNSDQHASIMVCRSFIHDTNSVVHEVHSAHILLLFCASTTHSMEIDGCV